MIQDMILLVSPEASIASLWKTTLIVFLFVFLTVAFNVFFAQQLPLAEGIVLAVHIFGFFAFMLTVSEPIDGCTRRPGIRS